MLSLLVCFFFASPLALLQTKHMSRKVNLQLKLLVVKTLQMSFWVCICQRCAVISFGVAWSWANQKRFIIEILLVICAFGNNSPWNKKTPFSTRNSHCNYFEWNSRVSFFGKRSDTTLKTSKIKHDPRFFWVNLVVSHTVDDDFCSPHKDFWYSIRYINNKWIIKLNCAVSVYVPLDVRFIPNENKNIIK